MFKRPFDQILQRLTALEQRLESVESELRRTNEADAGRAQENADLRAELERKQSELVALGEQGLHVVEMLDAARKELAETQQRLAEAEQRAAPGS